MSDLTEQWKKRKLPKGDYYVLCISWCEVIDKLYYDGDMFFSGDVPVESKEIKEVLAPVPTYKKLNDILESEAKSHLQADSYYNKILELKELLKECRRDLIIAEEDCGWDRSELIQQIDEALQ